MITPLKNLFYSQKHIELIQNTLPDMFYQAEKESERRDTTGPEVGCVREKQIVSMFQCFLGKANVNEDIPALDPQMDVELFKKPLSIKTFTSYSQIKFSWTVDSIKVKEFIENYVPESDIFCAYIKWNDKTCRQIKPGLYYIPLEVAESVFSELGCDRYLKAPTVGTNPRGIALSTEASRHLLLNSNTHFIPIYWRRPVYAADGYERWYKIWNINISKQSKLPRYQNYQQCYMQI